MRKRHVILLAVCGLTLCGIAIAQSVDGLDVEAIVGKGETHAKDAEALAKEIESRADLYRADAADTTASGQNNMVANASKFGGAADGPIDFDEIVGGAVSNGGDAGKAPQLIVFASLSMPEQSLKRLIRDTSKAGGTVVFNGFPDNSMKAFQQGIMKVVEKDAAYANIGIDPRLFRAFDVKSVPVVVAVTSDFDLCDGFNCKTRLPPYDKMSGNVTLGFALETFADGKGPGAAIAKIALSRLERSEAER